MGEEDEDGEIDELGETDGDVEELGDTDEEGY